MTETEVSAQIQNAITHTHREKLKKETRGFA